MEEPTLDQNEIDALLGGLDDSGGAGDMGGGDADVVADAAADDIMAGLDDSGGVDDMGGGASDDDLSALLGDDSDMGGGSDAGMDFNMGGGSAPAPKAAPAAAPARQAPTQLDVPEGNLEVLLDVPLEVIVELGRTDLQIKEILSLAPGSVVELNRMAGEPINIMVNGKLVARGEVVVIDENFGVKITHIISPMERLSQLN
jgi:flagellar motor switch protein FliN/FliY